MSEGPSHPAIVAEVRRQVRRTRVWMGLSAVIFLALCWGVVFPEVVVGWAQMAVVEHLPGLLQLVD